jgi:hypothetical protein
LFGEYAQELGNHWWADSSLGRAPHPNLGDAALN